MAVARRRRQLQAATKQRWFARGAKALGIVAPQFAASGYGCPLWLRASTNIDVFTSEDVPPFSVGGRPLLLTCKPCNDIGGHSIDTHWAKFAGVQGFATGDVHLTGQMILAGVETTIEIRKSPTAIEMHVVQKASSPKAIETQLETWKGSVGDFGVGLAFPKNRYDIAKVRASVLRAAYLTGFAVLGYRYLGMWSQIRDWVCSPDGAPHGRIITFDPTLPMDRRVLGVISEPAIYHSLLIGIGGWTVFLPLTKPSRLYDPIVGEESVTFTAQPGDWPVGPTFGLSGDLL